MAERRWFLSWRQGEHEHRFTSTDRKAVRALQEVLRERRHAVEDVGEELEGEFSPQRHVEAHGLRRRRRGRTD